MAQRVPERISFGIHKADNGVTVASYVGDGAMHGSLPTSTSVHVNRDLALDAIAKLLDTLEADWEDTDETW